ncbi:MAG: neutral/alkaline non-lysosomal ceramidase N-terminal domain-containing protein, partial [Armatimonadota bacterium]
MLFAGYHKCDITPPLGTPCALGLDNEAEEIFDPIYVRALVLGDGTTAAAILSLDLLGLNRCEVRSLCETLGSQTDIPPDNVVIHATHTHQSPNVRIEFGKLLAQRGLKSYDPAYCDDVWNAAALCIRRAASAQVACDVSYGEAPASNIASNRRIRRPDGSVVMRASRDTAEMRQYAEGHVDPLARIVSFRRLDGREIILQNFSCHPTATGGDEAPYVTADFPGHALRLTESAIERSDAMHLTGPCGDINPGKYAGLKARKDDAVAMGERLSKAVMEARAGAQRINVAQVEFRKSDARLSLRDDMPTQEELEARLEEDIAAYQSAKDRGEMLPGGGRLRQTLCRLVVHRNATDGALTTEVAALSLGDLLLVFLPGECFLEMAHVVRHR